MFRNVIVGWDGSDQARDALALADSLAPPGGRLVAAYAYPFDPALARLGDPAWERALERDAAAVLAGPGIERAPGRGPVERRVLPATSPARGLHELAAADGADLVCVGSAAHGRLGRLVLGTTGESLLRGAPCAVAVAPRGLRERPAAPLSRIAVGCDGSPQALAALRVAASLARSRDARLDVLAVAPVPAHHGSRIRYSHRELADLIGRRMRERVEPALTAAGVRPAALEVLRGDPAEALAHAAEGADLLIVGSRGYGPLRRVLAGSTSTLLLRIADVPVLVVPRGARRPGGAVPDLAADAA